MRLDLPIEAVSAMIAKLALIAIMIGLALVNRFVVALRAIV